MPDETNKEQSRLLSGKEKYLPAKPPRKPSRMRVDITVKKGAQELFPESFYEELPASGIWIEEKGKSAIIKCYPKNIDAFLRTLRSLKIAAKDVLVTEEPEQDYAELTKKYFRPIQIEGLTILAPWNKTKRKGPRILIEPGMAFGTGRHESTRLMIKLMNDVDMKGKKVLDIGCGSAILSLYAALLDAKKISAVDNDEDTVISARKNIELNNATTIEIVRNDLQQVDGIYDVVLANIDIRTFRTTSSHIMTLLRKGGCLVISGILGRDRKEFLSLFDSLSCLRMEQKNAWRGFIFQKNV
jgi:ribosomal protein L11 methyltransferase